MKSLRNALLFIGFAGFAMGAFVGAMILTSSRDSTPELDAAVALLIGWAFIGTGLFAWWRRPLNRTGALMTAVGFTWFLGPVAMADVPGVAIVGVIFNNLAIAVLVQLLLSFPGGRLANRRSGWFVATGYAIAVVPQLFMVLVTPQFQDVFSCDNCPRNPLAIVDNHTISHAIILVQSTAALIYMTALIVMLVRRWQGLGKASRAAMTPVLVTGATALALLGLQLIVTNIWSDHGKAAHIVNLADTIAFASIPFGFLVGLLRSRFSNANAVAELVADLGEAATREVDIREALATALGDRTLVFAYWLPERGSYVNADGAPIALPNDGSGRSFSLVEYDGELIAAIIFDSALDEQQDLVRSAGAAAGLALRNQRLEAELRANVSELRASRARIVSASDTARRRIERDLHDGAQQHLVALALSLRVARSQIEKDPDAAIATIDQAAEELSTATSELRELARGIHPAVLTDHGLAAALNALAGRSPVPVDMTDVLDARLCAEVESAAYFVVSEALTNVARYANAELVKVAVQRHNGTAMVSVSDDGVGGAQISGGSGLRGIEDRVAALDGTLTIISKPGSGTTITAEMPCAS